MLLFHKAEEFKAKNGRLLEARHLIVPRNSFVIRNKQVLFFSV